MGYSLPIKLNRNSTNEQQMNLLFLTDYLSNLNFKEIVLIDDFKWN